MLNLLRMDMYRLLKGRAFYICLGIIAVTLLIAQFFVCAVYSPEMTDALLKMGITVGVTSNEVNMAQASILEVYHKSMVSGGMFALVVGCLASIMVGADFEHGFIKNILSVHENKWKYILSKIVSLSIVNFIYILVTLFISLGFNWATGNFFKVPPIQDILFFSVSVWFLLNGFVALIMMIYILTRSNGAAIASAILLGSGTVVTLVGMILQFFNADKIISYTLYMNMSTCPYKYTDVKSLQALLVGVICCILYTVIAKLVLSKKDI